MKIKMLIKLHLLLLNFIIDSLIFITYLSLIYSRLLSILYTN